mmetsp:Transcript_68313/g.220779  ORF Transcript_68313/g.220779 Transcript_68313/m.220779 type:complete len:237 (+) Transcript_68313:716-1426(+)
MVVQEDDCPVTRHEAPLLAKLLQVIPQEALRHELGLQRRCVAEFSDRAIGVVHRRLHRLVGHRGDLQEPVEAAVDAGQEAVKLACVHVFGRIDPEAGDAELRHVMDVGRDRLLHARAAGAEVRHALEVAVLDVVLVVVVAHAAITALVTLEVVEVLRAVERVGAEAVAAASHAHAAHWGAMVEDSVHIDADPGVPAAPHHRGKLLLIARAAREVVAHRLVAREPLTPCGVLVRGRD